MTNEQITELCNVYRGGLPYDPPVTRADVDEFYAAGLNDEFHVRNERFKALSTKVNTENGTKQDAIAVQQAKANCEEVRDAMRALWALRKAERVLRRKIEITELRSVIDQHCAAIFPNCVETR